MTSICQISSLYCKIMLIRFPFPCSLMGALNGCLENVILSAPKWHSFVNTYCKNWLTAFIAAFYCRKYFSFFVTVLVGKHFNDNADEDFACHRISFMATAFT